MTLKRRIGELEQRTGAGKQVVIRVCDDGDDTEPTEAQREAAIADYKAKNPDWKEGDFIVLYWKDGQFEAPHTLYNKRGSKIKSRPFGR